MITFANAKINLGLNVVRRRPDGYHDLETIFYPAGKGCGTPDHPGNLCDIIEMTPANADSLRQTGLIADCDIDNNLVMKALRRFRHEAAAKGIILQPMSISLEKHIPFGAGTGGGSADASATLLTLNDICGNPFSTDELIRMADTLGADCPFFILNTPAYATGTGDRLEPIQLDLSGYWLALVKPDVSVSTREAFGLITPQAPERNLMDVAMMPVSEWKRFMRNDFEAPVFTLHPQLERIKRNLYECGALYASMSGSGSSFFGIFADRQTAEDAAAVSGCPHRSVTMMQP